MESNDSKDVMSNKGPLNGYRIIELGSVIFGPYGAQICADLGAEVIKVENVGGDIVRYGGDCPTPRMGPLYMRCNRNKQSVELDLNKEVARDALKKLIESADVFYTNVRPGGLKRLGFDYDGVKAINPNVIYVHCVGFGTNGPYGGRQAFDDLVQAAAGVGDLIPMMGRGDEPCYLPALIGDKTGGLHAAYATIAALLHRERTGESQYVEVPMFEALVSFNAIETMFGNTFVPQKGPSVYPRSVDPNRKPYPTKDGYIGIVPYNDGQWLKFFELAGRSNVMEDPRFATFKSRTENIGLLYKEVEEAAKTKNTSEWDELLCEAGIACMPYNGLNDVLNDEHLNATGFFEKRTHQTTGWEWISVKHPVTFEKSPAIGVKYDPPLVGQDNQEVLSKLGYSADEIKNMRPEDSGFTKVNI